MKYAFVPPSLERLSQLDTAPSAVYPSEQPVDIEGVVSVRGQSGWGGRHPDHDIRAFTLSAWRHVGGPVTTRDLLVLRAVEPHDNGFSLVKPGDFLRLHVLLDQGEHRSLLASVETLEQPDEALRQVAEALAAPVTLESERFGTLTLDRAMSWFSGEATWQGHGLKLRVDHEPERQQAALATADALFADEARWQQELARCLVRKLLGLKNDSWLEDDEAPLTEKDFLGRLRATALTVDAEGRFTFWYDDGDVFWGHGIEVHGTLAKGVYDASMGG